MDKMGRKPEDVVFMAYEAAIAGDFHKANMFGTPEWKISEERIRNAIAAGEISADMPSTAWTFRVARISSVKDLKLGQVKMSQAFKDLAIVRLETPMGITDVDVVLLGDQWLLSGGDNRVKK